MTTNPLFYMFVILFAFAIIGLAWHVCVGKANKKKKPEP